LQRTRFSELRGPCCTKHPALVGAHPAYHFVHAGYLLIEPLERDGIVLSVCCYGLVVRHAG
jgi:hypothetical protein